MIQRYYLSGQAHTGESAVANRCRWVKLDMLEVYALCSTKNYLSLWMKIDDIELASIPKGSKRPRKKPKSHDLNELDTM